MNKRQKILAFMTMYAAFVGVMTMYAAFVGGVSAALGVVGVALFCVVQLLLLTATLP